MPHRLSCFHSPFIRELGSARLGPRSVLYMGLSQNYGFQFEGPYDKNYNIGRLYWVPPIFSDYHYLILNSTIHQQATFKSGSLKWQEITQMGCNTQDEEVQKLVGRFWADEKGCRLVDIYRRMPKQVTFDACQKVGVLSPRTLKTRVLQFSDTIFGTSVLEVQSPEPARLHSLGLRVLTLRFRVEGWMKTDPTCTN